MANTCFNNVNIIIDAKQKDDIFLNDKFFNLSIHYNEEEMCGTNNYPNTIKEHVFDIEDAKDYKEWALKYFTSFTTRWDFPRELIEALASHPWVYYIEWWFQEIWGWILWSIHYNYEEDKEGAKKWSSLSVNFEDFPEYAYCNLIDKEVHKNLPKKESAYWWINDEEDNIDVKDYIAYFYNNENLSELRVSKEDLLDKVLENVEDTLDLLDYDSKEIAEVLKWIKNHIKNNYL